MQWFYVHTDWLIVAALIMDAFGDLWNKMRKTEHEAVTDCWFDSLLLTVEGLNNTFCLWLVNLWWLPDEVTLGQIKEEGTCNTSHQCYYVEDMTVFFNKILRIISRSSLYFIVQDTLCCKTQWWSEMCPVSLELFKPEQTWKWGR